MTGLSTVTYTAPYIVYGTYYTFGKYRLNEWMNRSTDVQMNCSQAREGSVPQETQFPRKINWCGREKDSWGGVPNHPSHMTLANPRKWYRMLGESFQAREKKKKSGFNSSSATYWLFLSLNICIYKHRSNVMISELNEIKSVKMYGKQTWGDEVSSKTHWISLFSMT